VRDHAGGAGRGTTAAGEVVDALAGSLVSTHQEP